MHQVIWADVEQVQEHARRIADMEMIDFTFDVKRRQHAAARYMVSKHFPYFEKRPPQRIAGKLPYAEAKALAGKLSAEADATNSQGATMNRPAWHLKLEFAMTLVPVAECYFRLTSADIKKRNAASAAAAPAAPVERESCAW